MSPSCCPNGNLEFVVLIAGGSSLWARIKELSQGEPLEADEARSSSKFLWLSSP